MHIPMTSSSENLGLNGLSRESMKFWSRATRPAGTLAEPERGSGIGARSEIDERGTGLSTSRANSGLEVSKSSSR